MFSRYKFICSNNFRNTQIARGLCITKHLFTKEQSWHTDSLDISLFYNNEKLRVPGRLNLLKEFFGISGTTAKRITEQEPRIKTCDPFILLQNIKTLRNENIEPQEVRKNLQLLYYCPLTVEHRINMLKELGLCGLQANHYVGFTKIWKSEMHLLKSYGLVPEDYSVLEPLRQLQVPEEYIKEVHIPHSFDGLKLAEVHKKLSTVFLKWLLNCERENVEQYQYTYRPLALKSMKLQLAIKELLVKKIGFTVDKIGRNCYLLCGSPSNMKQLLSMDQLGGMAVKDLVFTVPKILNTPFQQLIHLDMILQNAGITKASIKSLPMIFTLHPDTVEKRLENLRKIPEYEIFRSHPRLIRAIYYQKKIEKRMDYLQVKDTKGFPSLNVLSGDQDQFDRFLSFGDMKQNRKDIINFLATKLNTKVQIFQQALHRYQDLQGVTLLSVKETLEFLQDSGYSDKQILNAPELLMYPLPRIKEQLHRLEEHSEYQLNRNLKEKETFLQFVLYYIDKKPYII
ncbi:mitochondrial transcription termination factor 5 [Oratosquilla oratoria]|uniref:mitochondrial transcription termination factor 5 n=1 Tax=Oratosquilla oratoria TaxID=337810 RepID=UPI003F763412